MLKVFINTKRHFTIEECGMKKILFIVGMICLVMLLSGCNETIDEQDDQQQNGQGPDSFEPFESEWETEQMILEGSYCDAEVIQINQTHYRLYYCIEPEVENAQEMHSAISTDGLTWIVEDGIRMTQTTFPDIIKLPDGSGYRMYHQAVEPKDPDSEELANMGTVSSISTDGLTWVLEDGFRLNAGFQSPYDDKYASDTGVILRPDGTYYLVYRGESGERLDQIDDVKGTPVETYYLLGATSTDGLNWTPTGIIVDTSKPEFDYYILGPELVYDGDVLKLYFFGIEAIYEAVSRDHGVTWEEERKVFPANQSFAPSDPTVIQQGDTWRMYYGIHLTGLYSARYLEE